MIYVLLAQKREKRAFYAQRTEDTKYSRVDLNQIGHD